MSTTTHLLGRYIATGDAAAFGTLVGRYGPLVLAACRRVLRDPEDIDDAFQATFLVLMRRAPSIRDPEGLGNWLYGVARRVALRAKRRQSIRIATEARRGVSSEAVYRDEASAESRELSRLLRAELVRLPEKYRLPIELCALGGMSQEEAAERIGCPVGTVKTRLSRARQRLRERLERRGVVVGLGLLWPAGRPPMELFPDPALINRTVETMRRWSGGQGDALRRRSPGVIILADEVCRGGRRAFWVTALILGGAWSIAASAIASLVGGSSAPSHASSLPANLTDILRVVCR